MDNSQSSDDPNSLIQFVPTKGTPVTGRHKDKFERISETVDDLELACEGALSMAQRTNGNEAIRWGTALARACSVFLRKMVIGDLNKSSTRLLDDDVLKEWGIGFHRLRRIPNERRTITRGISIDGGVMEFEKLNDETRRPEAYGRLGFAPQSVSIMLEWPLPGAASWTEVPNEEFPWTIAPEELFDLENDKKVDCNQWLGQQVVMFDDRGITLKDIIRMVVTYEGAHSINVSRLLEVERKETNKPSKTPYTITH